MLPQPTHSTDDRRSNLERTCPPAGRVQSHRLGIVLLATALLASVGCGGSEYPLVPVSGNITLNGKPLPDAQVIFSPMGSEAGSSSVGSTDTEGHFQLNTLVNNETGAMPGQNRVTITTARTDQDADERTPTPKEIVPTHYRDGSFHYEVPQEGTDQANIDIVAK